MEVININNVISIKLVKARKSGYYTFVPKHTEKEYGWFRSKIVEVPDEVVHLYEESWMSIHYTVKEFFNKNKDYYLTDNNEVYYKNSIRIKYIDGSSRDYFFDSLEEAKSRFDKIVNNTIYSHKLFNVYK